MEEKQFYIPVSDLLQYLEEKSKTLRDLNATTDYPETQKEESRFTAIINNLALTDEIKEVIFKCVKDINTAVNFMACNRGMAIALENIINWNNQLKENKNTNPKNLK